MGSSGGLGTLVCTCRTHGVYGLRLGAISPPGDHFSSCCPLLKLPTFDALTSTTSRRHLKRRDVGTLHVASTTPQWRPLWPPVTILFIRRCAALKVPLMTSSGGKKGRVNTAPGGEGTPRVGRTSLREYLGLFPYSYRLIYN